MSHRSSWYTGLGARPAIQRQEGVPYRRHPWALRRELVENIRRVEVVLQRLGSSLHWFDALQGYRAQFSAATMARRFGVTGVMSAAPTGGAGVKGTLPPEAFQNLRDLDLSFQRIHNYNPADHMTEGVVRLVYGRQRSKGVTSEEVEIFLRRERFHERTPREQKDLIRRVIAMVGETKRATVYRVRARMLGQAAK